MRQVCITQAKIVTALGSELDEIWHNLLAGKSGIKHIRRFSTKNYVSDFAALIEDLEATAPSSLIYSLLDRLLDSFGPVPSDTILITATAKAGIDSLERICRKQPADPKSLLPGEILAAISRRFNLIVPGININAACASSTIAIARGAALIATGHLDSVLICCFDLVTEFVHAGFSALKALSSIPCQPFDRNRSGLTLGEGGAALLLMSEDRCQRENRPCLGKILGWGVANDAYHMTAPIPDGLGLVQAIRLALQKSGLDPDEVCAINAHGTGTVYNDQMELTAFRRVFGHRNIPVHSVKGALGHTLGAAGGIEIVLGLKVLSEGLALPTIGCKCPEKGAEKMVSSHPVKLEGDYLLSTNSGFGGINAAIILERRANL